MDDPTFPYRVAFGLTVFGILGVVDRLRNPQNPTRLKEYAFLFSVTGVVMLYGLLHDAVTFAISPDYFRIVKDVPSDGFFPDVARLALMASWTAGLAIGLAMLVANNPSPRFPQLRYPVLARCASPLVASPVLALSLGLVASLLPRRELPTHVEIAWATHIGSYTGAVAGLVISVRRIRSERRALR